MQLCLDEKWDILKVRELYDVLLPHACDERVPVSHS